MAKFAQERVPLREDEADERIGDVVGCPWVAQIREEKGKVVDAAAAATSEDTRADEEELFSGADGVGVHGE